MRKAVILCVFIAVGFASLYIAGVFNAESDAQLGGALPSDEGGQQSELVELKQKVPHKNKVEHSQGSVSSEDFSDAAEGQGEAEGFKVRYDMQVDMYTEEAGPEVNMDADYDSYRVDIKVDDAEVVDMTPGPGEMIRE